MEKIFLAAVHSACKNQAAWVSRLIFDQMSTLWPMAKSFFVLDVHFIYLLAAPTVARPQIASREP
jgi:hypothetical protein